MKRDHEEAVRSIISAVDSQGHLASRESTTVEFKASFNMLSKAKYAKTMAAFANNRGGYILFGIEDRPRRVKGLLNSNFDDIDQEQFADSINSLFAPTIEWELGLVCISCLGEDNTILDASKQSEKRIGWIYTEETDRKPVIAQKIENNEKICTGDIFFRYRGRTEKIKFNDLNRIIEDRLSQEREHMFNIFETIRKSGTVNLGIVNYDKGMLQTPNGIDVVFERKLVSKVLKKAKFIKEGRFHESDGLPVIRVTGDIDVAEEVRVPEIEPDEGYPYLQKDLAEILELETFTLYALIHHFAMKEQKKFSISMTTSRSGRPSYKFSKHALRYLEVKIGEFKNEKSEMLRILEEFKQFRKR